MYLIFSNENVWWLCDSVKKKFPEEIQYCYSVYISNKQRVVRICKKEHVLIFYNHCCVLLNLIYIVLFLFFFKRPRFGNKKQVIDKMDKFYGSVYNFFFQINRNYFLTCIIKMILSYIYFIFDP